MQGCSDGFVSIKKCKLCLELYKLSKNFTILYCIAFVTLVGKTYLIEIAFKQLKKQCSKAVLVAFERCASSGRTLCQQWSNGVRTSFQWHSNAVPVASNGSQTLLERFSNAVRTVLKSCSNSSKMLFERHHATFERRLIRRSNGV